MNAIIESFDYAAAGLSDDAKPLEMIAAKIEKTQRSIRKASVEAVLFIGRELVAARELLAHKGDGTFRKWARARFNYSDATISRIIVVRETFGDVLNVSSSIDVSALYLLSSPSCPEEIVTEAVERANAGYHVSHVETKEKIDAATVDPDPAPPAPSIAVPEEYEDIKDRLDRLPFKHTTPEEYAAMEAADTEAEDHTDDQVEPDSQEGRKDSDGNQEGTDGDAGQEAPLDDLRTLVLDWMQDHGLTRAAACSSLDTVRAEIWETYQ